MVTSIGIHITQEVAIISWMVGHQPCTCPTITLSSNIYYSQPPPPSSRPPVIGYKISHSITGSVMVNRTNNTKFAVECVAPGVYILALLAVNVFGDGTDAISSNTGDCEALLYVISVKC